MTLKAELVGDTTVKMNNIEVYSLSSPVSKLCRTLINQGFKDQPLELFRGPMLCLTVKSIKEQAKLSMREEPYLSYYTIPVEPEDDLPF